MLVDSFVKTGSQVLIKFCPAEDSTEPIYLRAEILQLLKIDVGEYELRPTWAVVSLTDAGPWQEAMGTIFKGKKSIKIDLNESTELDYGDSLVYVKYEPPWRVAFFTPDHPTNITPPWLQE